MTSRASPLGLGRIFIGGAFAVVTAACGGGSNAGAAAEAGIVGTWGVTSTAAQGTSSKTDEAFLVYGSDGTARDLFRTTVMAGGVTSSSVHCGAGTYAYANGVVTSTIEEKTARLAPPGAPGAGMDATTTATVMASAKVELIDGKMRQTGDADGSTNVTLYTRATLPSGLEASCPK